MGRTKEPTNVLKMRGSFKNHPERENKNEPKSDLKFPKNPPTHLDKQTADCWREVVPLVPGGVLTGADVLQVEIVASLLAEFRAFNGVIPTARLKLFSAEMAKLGLNPSARASLNIEKPDPDEDEFDGV